MNQSKLHFWIIVSIVGISGFSQGMLLPLLAIIFEHHGVSSSINGLHAAGLYIGILLASPFMEQPLRKLGYKKMILIGGCIVFASLFMFPLWTSIWFWFVLRMLIGIGDHMLHFATQTWITASSPIEARGRNISIYGLFFGIGFAAGPVLTNLVEINENLPFFISSGISLLAWLTIFILKDDYPEQSIETVSFAGTISRFGQVTRFAWLAFLPAFSYGFVEASLNGNFPVYALRNGIDVSAVSILLPAFAIGAILTQFPLGWLSDKIGRKKVLLLVMLSGCVFFMLAGMNKDSFMGLFICFLLAGMMTGSTFSLGISYMADLTPASLLPAGNLMCGICFSVGSLAGPFFGGVVIEHVTGAGFFYVISSIFFICFLLLALFKPVSTEQYHSMKL
ncbi:MFS family permease [Peribacillus deserti]|uniref:MFS family permease n=1 Tax=Peribacillus deserti TaxID=673318 RepID=A0ABS2QKF3_9BACI|nr:MFS transporter [Peribacillus deserti]MBM7693650.1 MFS family permease [Peribacillus deserti]